VTPTRLDALLAWDPTVALMEAMQRAHELGLSPPTEARRDHNRRQAIAYLIKHGKLHHLKFARQWTKDVKSGRAKRTAGRAANVGRIGAAGR
jgi:hypothetical protein